MRAFLKEQTFLAGYRAKNRLALLVVVFPPGYLTSAWAIPGAAVSADLSRTVRHNGRIRNDPVVSVETGCFALSPFGGADTASAIAYRSKRKQAFSHTVVDLLKASLPARHSTRL